MSPNRKKVINNFKVEEYYWAGKLVVYINNHLTKESFEEACDRFANPPQRYCEHCDSWVDIGHTCSG